MLVHQRVFEHLTWVTVYLNPTFSKHFTHFWFKKKDSFFGHRSPMFESYLARETLKGNTLRETGSKHEEWSTTTPPWERWSPGFSPSKGPEIIRIANLKVTFWRQKWPPSRGRYMESRPHSGQLRVVVFTELHLGPMDFHRFSLESSLNFRWLDGDLSATKRWEEGTFEHPSCQRLVNPWLEKLMLSEP